MLSGCATGILVKVGVQAKPLDAGQLSTDCLALPGVLSQPVRLQSDTGGKGKWVKMGDIGGKGGRGTTGFLDREGNVGG